MRQFYICRKMRRRNLFDWLEARGNYVNFQKQIKKKQRGGYSSVFFRPACQKDDEEDLFEYSVVEKGKLNNPMSNLHFCGNSCKNLEKLASY